MQTSNPTLTDNTFSTFDVREGERMTMQGTVTKTAILLLLAMITAGWTWIQFVKHGNDPTAVSTYAIVGALGGFVIALVTAFKPAWASITSPMYAVLQGLFMGAISAIMEQAYPGIVMQAIILTFGTLFAMLALYQSGFIRVTEKLKMGIMAATGGIAIAYIATMILSLFHVNVPLIYGNSWVGIGFSLFVIVIAALNFVLDFDFIEQGAKRGAPKYMEWYGAFALMVTLIWLYIEFLRLLSKLRGRD
jgi:uncharacterized YccA/Bax inhibitor family protein